MVHFGHRQTKGDSLDQMLQERDAMLEELQINLAKAQQRMKQYADKSRWELTFEEGEICQTPTLQTENLGCPEHEKLAWKYYGPYKITQKIGKVAYKLDLPPSSLLHPVLHVSQIKRAPGAVSTSTMVPLIAADVQVLSQPENVLQVRALDKDQLEILVQWEGIPRAEATWENYAQMLATYPDAHLEDKVESLVAGIVIQAMKVPKMLVCRRRKRNEKE